MNRADFEAMVRRMCDEVPPEFLEGVAEVTVSPRVVPHPTRADVYTLGECIPLPLDGAAAGAVEAVQSRVVLYHGSFRALAELDPAFDWRREAWETLTHELRHHLEWRARAPELEAFDGAVEENFARQEGEPFDPTFYREGERVDEDVYRVEDDYFIERVVATVPASATFAWRGLRYRVRVPSAARLPAFLTVADVADPPAGDLVVVLRRKPGLRALFSSARAFEAAVEAEPAD